MLEGQIRTWLSRAVAERSINQCLELSAVLASDIGLQRSENQDRVAAIRFASGRNSRPLIAVAVADGMGGMRDGGECATLAVSSFFHSLYVHRNFDIERRARAAISSANEDVYKFSKGKGGATLSALILDSDATPFLVHLGDSRVYSYGSAKPVARLTVDDSLAEAVGGHGRDLLQFVGMGEGMQPHIRPVPPPARQIAITTDGIHFINAITLEQMLSQSATLKTVAERLTALARWCGGPDNASLAVIDTITLKETVKATASSPIQLWDPYGSLALLEIGAEITPTERPAILQSDPGLLSQTKVRPEPSDQLRPTYKPKKGAKAKKPNNELEDDQLEIKIEQTEESKGHE